MIVPRLAHAFGDALIFHRGLEHHAVGELIDHPALDFLPRRLACRILVTAAFLERHAELLRALPDWTLRLLVPRHKTDALPAYEAAFREHLATPLEPAVLDDLRWYFRARRNRPDGCDERFDQAARAFGAPRFQALYRAWVQRGDRVLEATLSSVLADALAWSTGKLETHVLPHSYLRLLSLVDTA